MNLPFVIKVNIVPIIQFVTHFFKKDNMRFKRFWKTKQEPAPIGKKRALFFAINDYKGSNNDLRGCVNDQKNFIKRLQTDFPEFVISSYRDSEVTVAKFISEVSLAIDILQAGDVLCVLQLELLDKEPTGPCGNTRHGRKREKRVLSGHCAAKSGFTSEHIRHGKLLFGLGFFGSYWARTNKVMSRLLSGSGRSTLT